MISDNVMLVIVIRISGPKHRFEINGDITSLYGNRSPQIRAKINVNVVPFHDDLHPGYLSLHATCDAGS